MEPQQKYTTRQAAEVMASAGIFPNGAKPINYRGVARLCKLKMLPGAHLVQGDWCIPQSAIDKYARAIRKNTDGRPPRKKSKQ